MNREAYERWKLEFKLVNDQLVRIEQAEHTILKALGCPTDPVAIYAILKGERPAPWPKRTAARDTHRARVAMFALLYLREVRNHIGVDGNPRRAAEAALQLGALAGDVVLSHQQATIGARTLTAKRNASKKAAAARAARAAANDKNIRTEAISYRSRHHYDRGAHSTRTMAAHVAKQLRLEASTVRRRLSLIGIP